jgi:predicted amidohydrolase
MSPTHDFAILFALLARFHSHCFLCTTYAGCERFRQSCRNASPRSASRQTEIGIALFPEAGLSAYAIEDLLFQDALLDAIERAIDQLVEESRQSSQSLLSGHRSGTRAACITARR